MSRLKLGAHYYYHGTTLENAKEILKTMTLKGTRSSIPPMYSLSTESGLAEAFGPIVFCFINLNKVIEVIYTEEWFKKYPRIADYIFCGGYDGGDPACMGAESEYVGIGDLKFTESQLVDIFISNTLGDKEDISKVWNELNEINPNVKIRIPYGN